ncbi:MAG TPA: Ig domain-containing protein [Kiritimatiellia bacterium]|nr:Ig domain-containing protein [Kiritimatiellia bacterium]HPS07756.1 Ig domain-containing protein [Kiritimatiellia bacterium]
MKRKSLIAGWTKVALSLFLVVGAVARLQAIEGVQELEPYKLWLDGLVLHRSTMSPEAQNLGWMIKENGLQKLSRSATGETAYTYYNNRAGFDFVVYLDCWKVNRYARTSNTVGYRVGVDYAGPIISSERAEVAKVNKPYAYQITATGAPTKLQAANLPEGLSVDSNGLIQGTPVKTGKYLITLYAENNRDWTTATLRLDVVSGNNGGGMLDFHTLVLDENYVVTRTHGDGPYGGDLTMIVKRNGTQVLGRNALGDTRYKYYMNYSGYTYTIHLEYLGQRVSNIVTYTPPNAVYSVCITSAGTHSGIAGEPITPYVITTDQPCNQFSAAGLPSGLEVTATGTIVGVPTEYGLFPVTLSASGAGGVATKTVTFNIQQGSDDYTTKYRLSIDEQHVVTRTAGEQPGLVWVVRVNGNQEVVLRSAAGESTFSYSSEKKDEHIQIRLEAWIKGKYRPVSNTVTYTSDGTPEEAPVFSMEDSYSCYRGSAIDPILVQVSGNPTTLTVKNLPAGLAYDSALKTIKGTPTTAGTNTSSITAANAFGTTTLALTFEVLPDTRVAVEERFRLTVLPSFNIKRTFGTADSLRWVVCRNGQRVYEYPDAGKIVFNYGRHDKPGEFVVFLEAFVDGETVRVSNYVGYRTFGNERAPVLLNDRKFTLQTGVAVSIALQATGEPVAYAADRLPAGLALNSATGLISGTPSQVGLCETALAITGAEGVSETPVIFETVAPMSTDTYLKRYVVELDDLNRMTRSPGTDMGLTWVIAKDGQVVLIRNAKDELTYTYVKNYIPGVYTCYLQAYISGAYRQVSNKVTYTVEAHSDFSGDGFPNLVEHAMGTRAGTEPHGVTPDLVRVIKEGGFTYLTYRYSVNTEAQDVGLYVDCAKTLGNWTRTAPVSVSIVSADENHEVRDAVFRFDQDCGFLRLVAERIGE